MVSLQPTDPDSAWLATLTVLYVEDDEETRSLLGRFLRRRVGRLVEAVDGVEGLERFRSEMPALVVTDIQMPRMDGLALAEELRRVSPRVPVIVTTAFEQIDYLRRSIEAGVDKYVTKPVDADKLEAALLACTRVLRADALLASERQHELERLRAHEREALGMLAGGMAHDFNNLLQSVLTNLELTVPLTASGTEEREMLDDALASAQQAAELGQRLLTLSSGWPTHLVAGPVGPTLREALARTLAGSATTLRLDLPAELPAIEHDQELLGRAFEQLARNAREAMADGGVLSVTVQVRQLGEAELAPLGAGRYLQVTFRDNGPGIAPEHLPRIFDPYFSTKQRGTIRGMGLSLALCRAIARQHGGVITAASPPGEGAAFTILFPAVAA